MLSGDESENKPVKKPASKKGKKEQAGKKAELRKQQAAPQQELQADKLPEVATTVEAVEPPVVDPVVASAPLPDYTAPAEEAPLVPVATAEVVVDVPVTEVEVTAAVPVPTVEMAPVSYQTIVDAYRDYTQHSLDQTQTFFGRLAGVRSLDKAFELQTEFAKQAYDGFVTESRRIRELHGQLARQRLQHWEGLVTRMISPR